MTSFDSFDSFNELSYHFGNKTDHNKYLYLMADSSAHSGFDLPKVDNINYYIIGMAVAEIAYIYATEIINHCVRYDSMGFITEINRKKMIRQYKINKKYFMEVLKFLNNTYSDVFKKIHADKKKLLKYFEFEYNKEWRLNNELFEVHKKVRNLRKNKRQHNQINQIEKTYIKNLIKKALNNTDYPESLIPIKIKFSNILQFYAYVDI